VLKYNDHVLELDEMQFDFGTSYELECETPEPECLFFEINCIHSFKEHDYSHRAEFAPENWAEHLPKLQTH
jgi:hypothetical protein